MDDALEDPYQVHINYQIKCSFTFDIEAYINTILSLCKIKKDDLNLRFVIIIKS